ncbi:MAG: hypothetical protein ACKPKO_38800, partial [Candidatus Fonsibacter sp.]
MKITIGGVHLLTKHDIQPVDARRSLLAGRPCGFSCGLFQAKGGWAWYQQIAGYPSWSGTRICWLCKATSDDSIPYS